MRIGLISCTKSKTPYPASARELYSPSALFRGALGYLEGRADHIYVLSAKYGLLPLDEVAAPYNQTLKNESPAYRRDWALKVLREIQARHGESLRGVTFEFHAGEAFSAHLRPLLEAAGGNYSSPVEGLPIGGRLQFYGSHSAAQDAPPARRTASIPVKHHELKIHAAVWLAAALLHEEGLATFSPARLIEEVDRRFGDTRPGVKAHVGGHCVANTRKHSGTAYNYLFRTEVGELRLFRPGDPLHSSRDGSKTAPGQEDIPVEFWALWRRGLTNRN